MKTLAAILAFSLSLFVPVLTHAEASSPQHPSGGAPHGVGGGHIPAHGPTNHTPLPSGGKPDMPGHPNAPHVDPGTDRWVG